MLPVITIVGRPNVGKSTLFNVLTKSRQALVADMPGVTRDRIYGEGESGKKRFIVVDTGGLTGERFGIEKHMETQARLAVEEADILIFLVDARDGLTPQDETVAQELRQSGKTVTLVVNKIDGLNAETALIDFHRLGLGEPYAISASHKRGINPLLSELLSHVPEQESVQFDENQIVLAIVGRPNVGKSTLINRMLGEERVVTFDEPGTTRDSIFIPMERDGKSYVLVDTAGVRRRGRVTETVEKFSVIKTLQAVEAANVVIILLDAQEDLTNQDLHLMGFVLDAGKAVVIGINKWDNLEQEQRDKVKRSLDRRLAFLNFARVHMISALHGTGVGDLFKFVNEAYQSAIKKLKTPELTKLLEMAIEQHSPPMVHGRRIKLRYAHAGGQNPPLIVLHGNQTDKVPMAYQRYLMNFFRKSLKLVGTPVQLEFKTGSNPFAGRKNKLTLSQERKKKRLIKFVKRKKKK